MRRKLHPVIDEVLIELIEDVKRRQVRVVRVPKNMPKPTHGYDAHKLKQVQQIIKEVKDEN